MGIFLRRRSCVFFLSCSARGRLLLSLFWCCFCPSSCGACGFPRRVLPQVTLWEFRNLSCSSCLSCSCSGALLLGFRCLGCVAWFSTWCRALPPGPAVGAASPAAGYPWGLLPFLMPSAWPTAVLVAYVGRQPFPFVISASPAPSGLQGFPGFCTLCQGCDYSLDNNVVVLVDATGL